jgi:pyrroline-5-carboxylate reductase
MLQQGFKASDLRVVEVSAEARERMQKQLGVAVAAAVDAAIGEDVVLLAVKPQQMREVARAMQPHLRGQLVISIAAGIRTVDLSRWLGNHGRIVRAMPNTPALLRAGISGLFAAPQASAADTRSAQRILEAVGAVIVLDREEQLDGITAVSGSGPAYVFYFIEALQQAAVALGFSPEQARSLALETFTGAARLAAASTEPVETLRARVTSKGGTTEAALKSMEADEIKRRIMEAIHAAARRSKELGDEFGQD